MKDGASRSNCTQYLNEFYPEVEKHRDVDVHRKTSSLHKDADGLTRQFYDRKLWDTVSEIYADDLKLFRAAGGRIDTPEWNEEDAIEEMLTQ